MKERRLFPRSKISCKISVIFGLRILVFNADIENIGEGGIRVVLNERLAASTPLDVEIFGKGIYIKLKGEVIWSNEKNTDKKERVFDTGIKFIDIDEYDRGRIKKLIDAFLSEKDEYL